MDSNVGEVKDVVIMERMPEGVKPGCIIATSLLPRETIATLVPP